MNTKVDMARAAAVQATLENAVAGTPAAMVAMQDQLAAALQLIADQAAQIAALTPKPPEPITARIYYSSLPFIKVPIMRAPGFCDFVQFVAGSLETSDPAVIAVMEAAVNTQGSGFSLGPVVQPPEIAEMQQDMATMAASSHAKMIAAGEKTA